MTTVTTTRRTAAGEGAGFLLIAGSAVAFSLAGLFTGLVQADVWTILFWRGVFGGLLIAGFILWRERGAAWAGFRSMGRADLLAAACSTGGTLCYIPALRLTAVADVTIIYATAPFIAAAIAWIWMRETESRRTYVASALALVGVVVMFGGAPAAGHLGGDLLALAMTAQIAVMMIVIRRNRQISMLPASCLSAFACSVLVLPLAHPLGVSGADFLWLVLFGTLQFGMGLLLLTLGSRLMSASQAALIGNVELPMGPLWVWLAFGQAPGAATWIGGAVVMAGVALDVVGGRRR